VFFFSFFLLHKILDVKLLSCPPLKPSGCRLFQGWMVQTNVVDELFLGKGSLKNNLCWTLFPLVEGWWRTITWRRPTFHSNEDYQMLSILLPCELTFSPLLSILRLASRLVCLRMRPVTKNLVKERTLLWFLRELESQHWLGILFPLSSVTAEEMPGFMIVGCGWRLKGEAEVFHV